jgi:hypothetical protein
MPANSNTAFSPPLSFADDDEPATPTSFSDDTSPIALDPSARPRATLFAAFDNGCVRPYNLNEFLLAAASTAAAAAQAAAAAVPFPHIPNARVISVGLPLIRQHDAQVHASLACPTFATGFVSEIV